MALMLHFMRAIFVLVISLILVRVAVSSRLDITAQCVQVSMS